MTPVCATRRLAVSSAAAVRRHAAISAPLLLLLILGLDAVLDARPWSFVVTGLLDEPAHLATAGLILLALPLRVVSSYGGWMLVGSVVIDIDHLPLYLGDPGFLVDGGRPPTHSLAVVVVLLLMALGLPSSGRPLQGLEWGVLAHFVRDAATGPGLALLWPVFPATVKMPYFAYAGLLGLLTLGAIARNRAERHGRQCCAPGELLD